MHRRRACGSTGPGSAPRRPARIELDGLRASWRGRHTQTGPNTNVSARRIARNRSSESAVSRPLASGAVRVVRGLGTIGCHQRSHCHFLSGRFCPAIRSIARACVRRRAPKPSLEDALERAALLEGAATHVVIASSPGDWSLGPWLDSTCHRASRQTATERERSQYSAMALFTTRFPACQQKGRRCAYARQSADMPSKNRGILPIAHAPRAQ
jgi:hypothetical protein